MMDTHTGNGQTGNEQMGNKQMVDESKRSFLKKTAYVAPLALTLTAMPALARNGSFNCNNGVGNGSDCLPPGLEKNGKSFLDNDDTFGTPGNPQNRGGPN